MATRSKKTSRGDMEIIAEKLDKLTDMMDSKSTESSLQELVKEIRELRKRQEFLEKQYEDMKNHLKQTDGEMVRPRSENKELQRTVQELRKTTSDNQEAINSLEQCGRRECLEIKGLAWSQHKNTDELVVATAKKLNVNIKKDYISVSQRLSKCNKDNPRPNIIARFCSRRVRDLIFNNRSKLRDHAEKIFINESLTKLNRLRFNECLKFKKANNFKFIWTKHGITFLKKTEESSTISIRNETDMVRHRIRY